MNILNIIQCVNLGGMERSNLLMMKYYKEQGHEVTVVSLHPPGPGKPLYEEAGIPVIGCEYRGKFGLLSHHKLRKIVKSRPADVIFVTGASISSCLAARLHRVPRILCVHYHHGNTFKNRIKWRIFYYSILNDFDTVTFCSDFIRSEAESILPKLARKSVTLRNIIEIPNRLGGEEKSLARGRLGLPLGVPIIGNAGWLTNRKRFDVLLKTARSVMLKVPDLNVAIAGGGECETMLRKMAQDLGLMDRVYWLGWLPDLADFYQGLDVMVFNSDFDAFACTPIEAMAWGIPVVASVSYGGLREVIVNGENGFLIDNHNVEQLSNYVETLLMISQKRKDIGIAGRKSIENNFSAHIVGNHLNKLLIVS